MFSLSPLTARSSQFHILCLRRPFSTTTFPLVFAHCPIHELSPSNSTTRSSPTLTTSFPFSALTRSGRAGSISWSSPPAQPTTERSRDRPVPRVLTLFLYHLAVSGACRDRRWSQEVRIREPVGIESWSPLADCLNLCPSRLIRCPKESGPRLLGGTTKEGRVSDSVASCRRRKQLARRGRVTGRQAGVEVSVASPSVCGLFALDWTGRKMPHQKRLPNSAR